VTEPVIVRREAHGISRRNIDPDALKVLYRLHEHGHTAYLVGGSVRDLLLGRSPKDFDIGTSAHPYQIKKLFRNCWIIGRRFRLAHIKFGAKTIEVATFRRVVDAPQAEAQDPGGDAIVVASSPEPSTAAGVQPLHRDNSFGTPEEDAFRRDFTINGLFYDIGTFAVIDYVGGLGDLERRVVRSIGDPRVRFVEDPVRMLRAAVMTARLGFDLDPLVTEAIAEHRPLITTASPARLLEEYFKILRSGYAEASFAALGRLRLLELITPPLKTPPAALWDALARLDQYRLAFPSAPPELTNAVLLGTLLEPLGLLGPGVAPGRARDPQADRVSFGMLPVPRRDVERLRQAIELGPRLLDPAVSPRAARSLPHRPAFQDTLTWLTIHTDRPDVVAEWKRLRQHRAPPAEAGAPEAGEPSGPRRRRRRRRRRRGRGRGGPETGPAPTTGG
jgi:poly(A) polymerase